MTPAEIHAPSPDEAGRRFTREDARRLFPILLLVVLAAAFSFTSSRFLQFNNLMIVAQQAVVLLVAALGMTFVIIAGSIDLSVGAIVAVAALVAAKSSASLGLLAVVPACFLGLLAGLVNGAIVAKGKVPSFIVTLGTMVVYRGVVLYFTRGAPISNRRTRQFLDVYSGRSFSIPHSAMIASRSSFMAAICWLTVFGREVRAIGGGERIAFLTGIKVDRVKIMCLVSWASLRHGRPVAGGPLHGRHRSARRRPRARRHCGGGGRRHAVHRRRRQHRARSSAR